MNEDPRNNKYSATLKKFRLSIDTFLMIFHPAVQLF